MNSKPGFEFAAPWWRGARLSYVSRARTLVVEIPDRGRRVFRDVPARVYEMLKQSPEVHAASVADDGRRFAIAEAC
jgi:hypothetical protein